mgnify:CR=1 FL=1
MTQSDNEEPDDDGEVKLLENKIEGAEQKFSFKNAKSYFTKLLKKPHGKAIAGLGGIFVLFIIASLFNFSGKISNRSNTGLNKISKNDSSSGLIETPIKTETIEIIPDIIPTPPKALDLDDPSIPDLGDFKIETQIQEAPKQKEEIKIPEPVKESDIDLKFEEEVPINLPEKKVRKRGDKDSMIPMYNLSGTGPSDTDQGRSKKSSSDFIFMGGDIPAESDESYIEPKKIQALENTIGQGKNIDAVLETAINSEIPGNVRALVSRDVYAEVSDNVLIPKGSRLYGTYKTMTSRGQSRIAINFTRILRPDGVTADVSSLASDQFGRAGIEGEVDKKYAQLLGLTFMEAFIDIGTAVALNQIANNSQQQLNLNSSGGNQFIVPNPANQVATTLTRSVQSRTKEVANEMLNSNPVVIINQGTRIIIMVNQDLKLPMFKPIKSSYRAVNYYQSSEFAKTSKRDEGYSDRSQADGSGQASGYSDVKMNHGVRSAAPGG